jgi:hypothetical protein
MRCLFLSPDNGCYLVFDGGKHCEDPELDVWLPLLFVAEWLPKQTRNISIHRRY